jgi:cyclohexanone monooxygenase
VADKFDLRRDIRLDERMTRAEFDESKQRWTVDTEAGHRCTARFLTMAVGQLSATKPPGIPGRDSFAGEVYLTAERPYEGVDLAGKRVGVIGTGISGVQFIIATTPEDTHLMVFQRTPNFVVLRADAPITNAEDAAVKARYPERRERLRGTPTGLNFTPNKQSALEVTPEEREELLHQLRPQRMGLSVGHLRAIAA